MGLTKTIWTRINENLPAALYIASKSVLNVKMTFGPLLVVFEESSETTIRIAS